MVATTGGANLEDPCAAPEQDDTAWLVRQFGRFTPLLKEACTRAGGCVPSAADFGFLIGTNVIATQEHIQSRRLLQLSNKQHQEHLHNLQQLSAAHAQRLRTRARGQKRKRARGCEHNAESSSSSSSSEDEGAEGTSAAGKPAADRDAAGRCKERGRGTPPQAVSEGLPLAAPTEEATALLLSAYDLITCTTGSTTGAPASLPASLLTFLNSQEQRERTSSAGSRRKSEGSEAAKPDAGSKTGGSLRYASPPTDWMEGNGNENRSEQENLDPYVQFSELEAAEAHPIQQLQEHVMNLPCPNQAAKERLMREQLRLLAVRWKCLLLSGWNILVAGCGSKGRLLREFASLALNDGFCCVMNAYQREFKLHQALQAIVQVVRNHLVSHSKSTAAASAVIKSTQTAGGASASCMRLVKELKALVSHVPHLVYLVVLGLDSSALMDARRHLASLASCDKANHIQHALLVDAAELRDFRFVFETAHTRQDYREEVLSRWGSMCGFVPGWLWSGSRMQVGAVGGSSVNFSVVLRGLTTNHKRLLRSIAELQLAQLERNESPIVSLVDLGTEASGLSLSKLKLKELLIEVTSHGAAFHAKKNGEDAVAIRANKAQLQELLDLLEKAGV
ncbi:hypothetical protein Emag_004761 [Eimeria magna]